MRALQPVAADKLLVDRCIAGDSNAWTALVERFDPILRHRLGALAYRRGAGLAPSDLDDILSTLWEFLLKDDKRLLKLYQAGASLERWLFTIATYRLLEMAERKGKAQALYAAAAPLSRFCSDFQKDLPTQDVQARDIDGRIAEALEKLPPQERMAVYAFYWGGWSHKRIAWMLNVPVRKADLLLKSGRVRLRELLRGLHHLSILLL